MLVNTSVSFPQKFSEKLPAKPVPEKEGLSRVFTEKDHVQTKEQEKVFNEKPNFTLKKLYTSNSNARALVPPPPQDLSNKATFPESTKFSRGVCSTAGGQGGTLECFGAL